MKKQARTVACSLHVSRLWAWVSLVPLLAGACKPHDLVCNTEGVFQALKPEQGAGVAPFSIERLGPEVKLRVLEDVPDGLTLKRDNRMTAWWTVLGHISRHNDLIFSPDEGLARNVKHPDDVYPMRRFTDGASERVRFGFRSTTCRDPGKSSAFCGFGEEELFLVAEMTCHRE